MGYRVSIDELNMLKTLERFRLCRVHDTGYVMSDIKSGGPVFKFFIRVSSNDKR